jgi:hypothetical protein
MIFLIRSAAIGAIIYGLFVWGFGATASWTWYIVTACVVTVILFIGTASVTTIKWAVILTIINELLGDYRNNRS